MGYPKKKILFVFTFFLLQIRISALYGQNLLKEYFSQGNKEGQKAWKLGLHLTEKGWKKDKTEGFFKEFDLVWKQPQGTFVVKKLIKVSERKSELISWLVDSQGKRISKVYTDLGDFREGLAEISMEDKCQTCWPERYDFVDLNTAQHGFIDQNGKEIIKPQYRRIATSFHEGKAAVGYWTKDVFYIDKAGNPLFNKIFKNAGPFINGIADVQLKDNSLNCINVTGELLIPNKYSYIRPYENGEIRAFITPDKKVGFLSENNENLISPIYDDFNYEIWTGTILVKKDNLFGFISKTTGQVLIPAIYDDYLPSEDSTFIWLKNGKIWKKTDRNHFTEAEIEAGQLRNAGSSRYVLQRGKLWGLCDMNAHLLSPIIFDYILPPFNEGKAVIMKNGKYGYINSTGKILIPPTYEKISHFERGTIQGFKGIYIYTISDKNKILAKTIAPSIQIYMLIAITVLIVFIALFWILKLRFE